MSLLYEITCSHCKHLSGSITCGVCEVTNHKVEKYRDNIFAEQCDFYENKYYDVSSLTDKELEIKRKVVDEILGWIESETYMEGRVNSTPGAKMIVEHLKNMKQ